LVAEGVAPTGAALIGLAAGAALTGLPATALDGVGGNAAGCSPPGFVAAGFVAAGLGGSARAGADATFTAALRGAFSAMVFAGAALASPCNFSDAPDAFMPNLACPKKQPRRTHLAAGMAEHHRQAPSGMNRSRRYSFARWLNGSARQRTTHSRSVATAPSARV